MQGIMEQGLCHSQLQAFVKNIDVSLGGHVELVLKKQNYISPQEVGIPSTQLIQMLPSPDDLDPSPEPSQLPPEPEIDPPDLCSSDNTSLVALIDENDTGTQPALPKDGDIPDSTLSHPIHSFILTFNISHSHLANHIHTPVITLPSLSIILIPLFTIGINSCSMHVYVSVPYFMFKGLFIALKCQFILLIQDRKIK